MGLSVAEFRVTRYVRGVESATTTPLAEAAADEAGALARAVTRARLVDAALSRLFRDGALADHRSIRGHEAALVGAAAALAPSDWFFGEGDELPVALLRGVPLARAMSHLLGGAPSPLDDRARRLVASGWRNAAHLTHAAGFAWGARIAKDDVVALASFRADTIAEGEFHNGVNFAGVFKAPVVFLCRSFAPTGGAEEPASVPVEHGVAYGVRAVVVDAGDAHAVAAAVREAVARARAGEGPTLVEARSAKDADGDADMNVSASASANVDAELARAVEAEVAAALAEAEKAAPPTRGALFDGAYAAPPWSLAEQRALASGEPKPSKPSLRTDDRGDR